MEDEGVNVGDAVSVVHMREDEGRESGDDAEASGAANVAEGVVVGVEDAPLSENGSGGSGSGSEAEKTIVQIRGAPFWRWYPRAVGTRIYNTFVYASSTAFNVGMMLAAIALFALVAAVVVGLFMAITDLTLLLSLLGLGVGLAGCFSCLNCLGVFGRRTEYAVISDSAKKRLRIAAEKRARRVKKSSRDHVDDEAYLKVERGERRARRRSGRARTPPPSSSSEDEEEEERLRRRARRRARRQSKRRRKRGGDSETDSESE